MKIVAALAYWAEPLPFLDRLVRSLAGHVDALVALDGPWYGFDGGPVGTPEERDTIRAAAAECDLPCNVVWPIERWESQAEKRAELFRLAIDESGADWVLVVDGDERLAVCDDDALRRSLALTDRDVVLALETQLNKAWPYSEFQSTHDNAIRHMYRGIPGLTVETAHNGIRTPDFRWLHGDPEHVRVQPALDLSAILRFEHDNRNRGKARNDAARRYRRIRSDERLESWR